MTLETEVTFTQGIHRVTRKVALRETGPGAAEVYLDGTRAGWAKRLHDSEWWAELRDDSGRYAAVVRPGGLRALLNALAQDYERVAAQ